MKRGKRFLKNNNIYVYVGTVIFFILAIAFGIIMYMLTKTTANINNEASQITQQSQSQQNQEDLLQEGDFENVSTEIGKTVEEQTNEDNKTEVKSEAKSSEEQKNNTNNTNSAKSTKNQTEKTSSATKKNTTREESASSETTTESDKKVQETKKEITFTKPTEGEVICEFAKDNLIYSETLKEWITHTAVDIKADKTSVVKVAADGIVRSIVNDPRYGLTVVIEHDDGYQTVYSNLLTAEFVVEGEEVKQGQTLGTVGNTAAFESEMESHLHFELIKDGEYLDPSIYLK